MNLTSPPRRCRSRRLILFATTALLATTAIAADAADVVEFQQNLPKCAGKCLATGAKEQGCTVIDIDCQCNHLQAIINSTSPCLVQAGCTLDDISDTAEAVAKVCADQIASLTAQKSTPAATPTGAASRLPQSLALASIVAAMAVGAALL
ncbi:hypothetical protein B0T10DRAFT_312213 [Thelonectria olida]|uniref:CFEM domain-containing protein n=1 Tax=Thelonectria olida TaxID=1576542 RepID=A0A9P9ATT0_9HYPO|nr:hypothetical protein B0T10DRAFT_312213 [Thelonectria olida]